MRGPFRWPPRARQTASWCHGMVVTLAGQSAAVWHPQIALRPLQGLDRRLLIDAHNKRLAGRVEIKADDTGGLRGKIGIVALAPGLADRQIDLVAPQQAAPDILNVDVAQRLGQQRPGPPRKSLRRRLVQKSQYSLVRRRRIERLLAGPRGGPSDRQARDRQSGAATGSRSAAGPQPLWQLSGCYGWRGAAVRHGRYNAI
jgi:hypothetical protein